MDLGIMFLLGGFGRARQLALFFRNYAVPFYRGMLQLSGSVMSTVMMFWLYDIPDKLDA